jgi:hypothetical protein
LEFSIDLPPFQLPSSMTFAHRTRLSDSWLPSPERILQPEMQFTLTPVRVRVFEGSTAELGIPLKTRNPMRWLRQWGALDRSGSYLYDCRGQSPNMGHYIVYDAPLVLMLRARLSELLDEDVQVHVILKEGVSEMVRQIFAELGLPVILTDARVSGRILEIRQPEKGEAWSEGRFCHHVGISLMSHLPEVYRDYDFAVGGGPEKIFVSRKRSRTISNEDEIAELLAGRGYRRVYFELDELPVREQWRIMAGAREIVGIHGAGLTSVVFNKHGLARPPGDRSGLRLVELFGAGYFVKFTRALMANMNGHWCGVRGEITPELVRDLDQRGRARSHQASSFHVDPEALELALNYSAAASSAPEPAGLERSPA